jgi:hypothetical protein
MSIGGKAFDVNACYFLRQGFPVLKKHLLSLANPHPLTFFEGGGKIASIGKPWVVGAERGRAVLAYDIIG